MDVSIQYGNRTIASMDQTGTKTLKTKGKLCSEEIKISYKRPKSSPDTKLINYEKFETYFETAALNGYVVTSFTNSNHGGYYSYVTQRVIPFDPLNIYTWLVFDWTVPFEIGVTFKVGVVYTSNSFKGVIFGHGENAIYGQPLLYLSESNSLVASFSTDGQNETSRLTFPYYSIKPYKWYFAKYAWDGEVFSLSLTDDFHNTKERSAAQLTGHNSPGEIFTFGSARGEHCTGVDYFSMGSINLLGTYIKSMGNLVWGCTYCPDNKMFDF